MIVYSLVLLNIMQCYGRLQKLFLIVAAKVYSSYDNSVDNEVGFAVPVAGVAVNVAAAAVYN